MEKPLQMSDFIQNGGVIIVGKMCIIRHFTKKCLTATKHSWKKFELIDKRSTVDTISFSDSFLFFSPYCMNWPEMLRPPSLFLWKAREKGSFLSSVFFCNQSHKIHSILQFFMGSFAVDLEAFGPFWGSFGFVGSFAVGDHLRYSADTSIKRTRTLKVVFR